MNNESKITKVAAVQIAPVTMDSMATAEKVCTYIKKAAAQGAQLLLFPEALISGYPWGTAFAVSVGRREMVGRDAYVRYWKGSIDVPGKETELIGKAAKEAGVYVAVGVMERLDDYSRQTQFCTLLYFGPDGSIIGKHRKLKPTAAERYVWGEGDGSTMPAFDTEIGRFGGLICWENYHPLARMAMYGKGLDIYLAPTADSRPTWLSTMIHIACESRCFVVSACQYYEKSMYPPEMETLDEIKDLPDILSRGSSVIISPMGEVLAGPLYNEEGILYADLNLDETVKGRFDFDVVGHYSMDNVFQLIVDEKPKKIISYE